MRLGLAPISTVLGLNPTLTLVANSRGTSIGPSLGNVGKRAKGKSAALTDSTEFATSANTRVMNRKVTERLVYVRLMSGQSPIGDFAFRFGAMRSPWSEAISGLERPVPTAFLSPFGLLRNPERLPCGWCRDCWVWAHLEPLPPYAPDLNPVEWLW